MKDNKEFINGIYEKYDEYQKQKQLKRTQKLKYIPIATFASIIIVSVLTTAIYQKNKINQPKINSEQIVQTSLAKVENFQNFYNLLKNQSDEIAEQSKYTNTLESEANSTIQDVSIAQEEYSQTNTQTEGVDEADIIKTDGKYIYYIVNQKVVIIDIQNSSNSKKISEIPFETKDTSLRELYLNEDKLVVIASQNELKTETRSIYETTDVAYVDGIKIKTVAIIYNIQNREKPEEERRIEIEGNYISSRMIDDKLYFATTKYISQAINMVKKYQIEDLNEDDYKPTYVDTAISEEARYIPFNKIQYFDEAEISNYLIIAGVNINTQKETNIQTFLGAGDTIYSSTKNMYIAKTITTYDINTYTLLGYKTKIIKFKLQDGDIIYKKDTTIDGKILNQFSMDEDVNENFRIATTQEIQRNITNSLYVLNSELEETGKVLDLANDERIKSVRYIGNKGYIVTFKDVDPLFVIDLSDPANPQKLGELKIPGYSTYLHPYDETHIIGLGYDTKTNGNNVQNSGLKLSMFDVSDINNPKELFTQKIGNAYTNSEAIYNHKVILYLKQKNIIAFPIQNYQYNENSTNALIYKIDINQGFILQKQYTQDITKDYQKRFERIIFANGIYYLASQKGIIAINENTWQEVEKIEI